MEPQLNDSFTVNTAQSIPFVFLSSLFVCLFVYTSPCIHVVQIGLNYVAQPGFQLEILRAHLHSFPCIGLKPLLCLTETTLTSPGI